MVFCSTCCWRRGCISPGVRDPKGAKQHHKFNMIKLIGSHYATSWKVAGSITDVVTGFFN
jgi:hypothetical protein